MGSVLPILSIIAGAYWVFKSFSYGLWIMNGPGGGLFPLVGGILTVAFGMVLLVRQFRIKAPSGFSIKSVFPVIGVAGIIGCTYLIGLIPSLGLFIILWLILYERYPKLKSIAIGLGSGVFLWLLFDLWLKVPVPMGLFELLY